MKMQVRIGAGLILVGLLWWIAASGWWEISALVAIGAGLGAVVARPPKAPRYAPTYWTRKDAGM